MSGRSPERSGLWTRSRLDATLVKIADSNRLDGTGSTEVAPALEELLKTSGKVPSTCQLDQQLQSQW